MTTAAPPRPRADPVGGSLRSTAIGATPRIVKVASVVVVLALWELVGRTQPLYMSYPSAVVTAGWELMSGDDRLLPALRTSLWGLTAGYVIAAGLGVALGLAMAMSRVLDIALTPYVAALYATPRITLIPLLVLWVGIDFQLRLTIVVLSAIFPIIINVRDGARQVSSHYVDVARSYGAGRRQVLTTVVVPGSVPSIFVALRIGLQRSLIGVIVAEMTSAVSGTGRILLQFGRVFQTDRLLVPILIIGFFSIFLTWVLRTIERRVTPWAR